jgi:hypothetical protein
MHKEINGQFIYSAVVVRVPLPSLPNTQRFVVKQRALRNARLVTLDPSFCE